MNELDERIRGVLRDIVAAAPDPPDFDSRTGAAPNHRRRRAIAVTAAILASLAVVLAATLLPDKGRVSTPVKVGSTPSIATPSTTAAGPGPAGFAAPLGPIQDSDASTETEGEGVDGVVVHLVVDADGVTGGRRINGHVQVINNTGHSLQGGAVCRADILAPVIYGGHDPERPVFPTQSCSTPFAFPVGATTLSFSLSAISETPSGPQPLPTGYYHVGVAIRGFNLPVPPPLTVIVLAPAPNK